MFELQETPHGIDYFLYFLPRETKGGRANCNKKAHTLSICGALCSTKQAERPAVMKKDQRANIWEGEEKKQQWHHSQPCLATRQLGAPGKFVWGRKQNSHQCLRLWLTQESTAKPKGPPLFSTLTSPVPWPSHCWCARPTVPSFPEASMSWGRCWRSSLPTAAWGKARN